MPALRPTLSICLPCHNEASHIETQVRTAVDVGSMLASQFEIIVVDDGSDDESHAILQRLACDLHNLIVLRHDENRGYGAALRTAFARVRYELAFYMDADGQFDIHELGELLHAATTRHVVCGYRKQRRDGWLRRWMGRAWTWTTNRTLGVGLRDVNCAFKLLPGEFVSHGQWRSAGALISAELVCEARQQGLMITEVGVSHYPRGVGKQSGARPFVIMQALVELAALMIQRIKRKRDFGRDVLLRKASRPRS